jgi:hypothetical protein
VGLLRRQIGEEGLHLKTMQLAVGDRQEICPLREAFAAWNSRQLTLKPTQSAADTADRGSDKSVLGGVRRERLAYPWHFRRQP